MATIKMDYNPSQAVRRLMMEALELREATEDYFVRPLEDNIFEWHFTIRGARDSVFNDGLYHGRIILPTEYPYKPPSIIFLTPNGRFQINEKICLSISGYHPETWLPSWSIRTGLLALIQFMPTPGEGHIGAINYPEKERRYLAKKSNEWKCNHCGPIGNQLKPRTFGLNPDYDLGLTLNLQPKISASTSKVEQESNSESKSPVKRGYNLRSTSRAKQASDSGSTSTTEQESNSESASTVEQESKSDQVEASSSNIQNNNQQTMQENLMYYERMLENRQEPDPAAESMVTLLLYAILVVIIGYIVCRLQVISPKQLSSQFDQN